LKPSGANYITVDFYSPCWDVEQMTS